GGTSRNGDRLGARSRGRRTPGRRLGVRGGHRPRRRRRRRGPGRAARPRGAAVRLEERVPLARYTTLGTGGPARAFARPETLEELGEALAWARERGLAVATVGLGSNLLVADEGVEALVVRLAGDLASVDVDGELLVAGGGAAK